MIEKDLKILDDFPPVSYQAWKARAVADLRDAAFDETIVTRTYDGIEIQPIYTPENRDVANDLSGFPGFLPYTRGSSLLGHSSEGWDVRQEISIPDPGMANEVILGELTQGVTSIALNLDSAASSGLDADAERSADRCGRDGIMIYSLGELERVLEGVKLEIAPVALDSGAAFLPAAALMAALWEKRNDRMGKIVGAFGADPLGALMREGALLVPLDVAIAQMADVSMWTAAHAPGVTSVRVSTAVYHHAGAGSIQDLAFAIATAVEYLRVMTEAGLDLDTAIGQIVFHESVGCKFFQAIAKLRALRKLWGRVTEASGARSGMSRCSGLVVETSRRVISHRDPWINLLRNTAACFAGAIGGADAIVTLPMDSSEGVSDDSTRRLARSTQSILREECRLADVIDPAGGSWFLESLTDEMAEKAWHLFQRIEAQGGMIHAASSGWVSEQIQTVESLREHDIATRKSAVTGVSEHPEISEQEIRHTAVDYAALLSAATARLSYWRCSRPLVAALCDELSAQHPGKGELMAAAVRAARAGATIGELSSALAASSSGRPAARATPLVLAPYAAGYEQLRDVVDTFARAHAGQRPKVFFAHLGTTRDFLACYTFAHDFFLAGGFVPLSNDGYADTEAVAHAFVASGALIAAICSADSRDAAEVEQLATRLKEAGARAVVLTGRPDRNEERYRAAGVTYFIYTGCNVLECVRSLLKDAGVKI